ncbi:unnamed protein product, partial [Closterium sp. NIES-53]
YVQNRQKALTTANGEKERVGHLLPLPSLLIHPRVTAASTSKRAPPPPRQLHSDPTAKKKQLLGVMMQQQGGRGLALRANRMEYDSMCAPQATACFAAFGGGRGRMHGYSGGVGYSASYQSGPPPKHAPLFATPPTLISNLRPFVRSERGRGGEEGDEGGKDWWVAVPRSTLPRGSLSLTVVAVDSGDSAWGCQVARCDLLVPEEAWGEEGTEGEKGREERGREEKWREWVVQEALDPAKHYHERRAVEVWRRGEVHRIADVGMAQVAIFDSIERAHGLLASFISPSERDTWQQLAFLLQWPGMAAGGKVDKLQRFGSHELHLFLFFHDHAFFAKHVLPAIASKLDRSFLDLWLLGDLDGVLSFCALPAYLNLNALERCLLGLAVCFHMLLQYRGQRPLDWPYQTHIIHPSEVLDDLITLAAPPTPALAAQAAAASYRRFTTALASRSDLRPRAAPLAEPPAKPAAEPAPQPVSAPKGAPPPPPTSAASFGGFGGPPPPPPRPAAAAFSFDGESSEQVRHQRTCFGLVSFGC